MCLITKIAATIERRLATISTPVAESDSWIDSARKENFAAIFPAKLMIRKEPHQFLTIESEG